MIEPYVYVKGENMKLIKAFLVGFFGAIALIFVGGFVFTAVLNAAEREAEFDRARWIDEQQGTEMLLYKDERRQLHRDYQWEDSDTSQ